MRNGHYSFLQPADSSPGNDWLGAECREAQLLSCAAYFGARVFLYVFCTGCFPPFCRCRCRCFYEAFLAPGWIREKTKWIERERERERERARAREREEEESWVGARVFVEFVCRETDAAPPRLCLTSSSPPRSSSFACAFCYSPITFTRTTEKRKAGKR